jgi:hypothetical protein
LVAELVPASHQTGKDFCGVGKHPVVIAVQIRQIRWRPKIQRETVNRLGFFLQSRVTLAVYAH